MEKFLAWIRQPSTIDGIGLLVGGVIAGIVHLYYNNVEATVIVGVIANILVKFGINDNSSDLLVVEHVTEEAASILKTPETKPNA